VRSCIFILLARLGCQDKSREAAKPPPPPDVKVVDAQGAVVAEMRQIRPCRAVIGTPQPRSGEENESQSKIEMIVGGPPIQSTVGSVMWSGNDDVNGTTFLRGEERIARMYPLSDPNSGAVFDMQGIAQVRIKVNGQVATVENRAGLVVRKLTLAGGTITSSDPALTITGTDDLVLAGLLSAPELLPEIRSLAACERVLLKKGS
jgi:hypothetical protein